MIKAGPNKPDEYTYDIEHADFEHRPTDEELTTPWMKPGWLAIDNRVNPPVGWDDKRLMKATGGKEITPTELLKLSQDMSHYFEEQIKQKDAWLRNRDRRMKSQGVEVVITDADPPDEHT